jgi:hypothetical protein
MANIPEDKAPEDKKQPKPSWVRRHGMKVTVAAGIGGLGGVAVHERIKTDNRNKAAQVAQQAEGDPLKAISVKNPAYRELYRETTDPAFFGTKTGDELEAALRERLMQAFPREEMEQKHWNFVQGLPEEKRKAYGNVSFENLYRPLMSYLVGQLSGTIKHLPEYAENLPYAARAAQIKDDPLKAFDAVAEGITEAWVKHRMDLKEPLRKDPNTAPHPHFEPNRVKAEKNHREGISNQMADLREAIKLGAYKEALGALSSVSTIPLLSAGDRETANALRIVMGGHARDAFINAPEKAAQAEGAFDTWRDDIMKKRHEKALQAQGR